MRRALLVAVLLFAAAAPAAAEWARVDTPRFVLLTDLAGADAVRYAGDLSRFHDALATVVPAARLRPAVPALIVLFAGRDGFAERRKQLGLPRDVGAFFAATPHDNLIVASAPTRERGLRALQHEYAHFIVHNAMPGVPLWVKEGLAEYYGALTMAEDGTSAEFGAVIPMHLARLAEDTPLPRDEFLTLSAASPFYQDAHTKALFYAQAWGVVHMLLSGDDAGRDNLDGYARLTAHGASPLEVWRQVMGDDNLSKRLTDYFAAPPARVHRIDIPSAATPATQPQTSTVDDGDIALMLALFWKPGAEREADAADAPSSPLGRALLGRIKAVRKDDAAAHQLLRGAASDSFDWLVQYHAAVGLDEVRGRLTGELGREAREAARAAIDQVRAARPEFPAAAMLKARLTEGRQEALALTREARIGAPGRTDWLEAEVRLAMFSGEWDLAEMRDSVLSVGSYSIVPAQQPQPIPAPVAPKASQTLPIFRKLQPGEDRIEGLLERLECAATGRVLVHVRTSNRLWRLGAARFSAIDFVSHRPDITGAIRCQSRRPPDRVYVTFTTTKTSGLDGTVVAVEFLPDGRK